MALRTAALSARAQAFFTWLCGEESATIQRVDGDGVALDDAVPCVHDEEAERLDAIDTPLDSADLVVFTAEPLVTGGLYRTGGVTYTCDVAEHDKLAGSYWPCRAELRRHA